MSEKLEFGGWWIWILALLIISVIAMMGLRAAGMIGGVWLERKVFEQSYQKQAGDAERLATFQAQLAEINARLSGELDVATRQSLLAQRAALNVQIQTIARKSQ